MTIILLGSACINQVTSQRHQASENQLAECRVVRHALGETCIPTEPQRVIAPNPLLVEFALALGIQPVGGIYPPHYKEMLKHKYEEFNLLSQLQSIKDLGDQSQPDLETIASLNPDLILTFSSSDGGKPDQYTQRLSQIAPTVAYNFESSENWKEEFNFFAEILNRTEEAEQWLEHYNRRINEFQQQLRQRGREPQQIEVSAIRPAWPAGFRIYGASTTFFPGSVVRDAGLSYPPLQEGYDSSDHLSKERIDIADGDIIFFWTTYLSKQAHNESQALDQLKADPLWLQLDAVKEGNAYEVPGYWTFGGPISADAILDDLFKYIVDNPSFN